MDDEELYQKEYKEYKREIALIDKYNKGLKQGEKRMMYPFPPIPRAFFRDLASHSAILNF